MRCRSKFSRFQDWFNHFRYQFRHLFLLDYKLGIQAWIFWSSACILALKPLIYDVFNSYYIFIFFPFFELEISKKYEGFGPPHEQKWGHFWRKQPAFYSKCTIFFGTFRFSSKIKFPLRGLGSLCTLQWASHSPWKEI